METHTQTLGEGLVNLGNQVDVITTSHPEGKDFIKFCEVSYHFLTETSSGRYTSLWWKRSVSKFADLNQNKKFDIVIGESDGAAGLLPYKDRCKVPTIQIAHGSLRGEVETFLRNISSFKEFSYFVFKVLPYALKTYFFLDLKSIRGAEAVICVSKELGESLKKDYFLEPKKLFTVYNGVDINKFKVRSEKLKAEYKNNLGIGDKEKVLLYLGRLEREKGIQILVEILPEVFSELKNVKCLIVGDGPLYKELINKTKNLNIENKVIFTGQVPYEETVKYYNAADLFVFPTLRIEGLPMVLVEAAACGLPVVASNIGGVPSVVEDGKTGFLIKPKDKEALKKSIIKLLKEEDLRKTMSDDAQRKAQENFTQEKMSQETLKIIKKTLAHEIGS